MCKTVVRSALPFFSFSFFSFLAWHTCHCNSRPLKDRNVMIIFGSVLGRQAKDVFFFFLCEVI